MGGKHRGLAGGLAVVPNGRRVPYKPLGGALCKHKASQKESALVVIKKTLLKSAKNLKFKKGLKCKLLNCFICSIYYQAKTPIIEVKH